MTRRRTIDDEQRVHLPAPSRERTTPRSTDEQINDLSTDFRVEVEPDPEVEYLVDYVRHYI